MADKLNPLLVKIQAEAIEYRKTLVESGQIVSCDSFCALAGVDAQYIETAILALTLFKFEIGGQYFYPRFYTEHKTPDRLNIEKISASLGAIDAAQKWQFFTRPKQSLGGITPIQAIVGGQFAKAAIAAQGFISR